MGGKAAAERRKAERAHLNPVKKPVAHKRSPNNGRGFKGPQTPPKGPPSKPKEKKKKPKHLDRKIQQAREDSDESKLAELLKLKDGAGETKKESTEKFKTMIVKKMLSKKTKELMSVDEETIKSVVDKVVGVGGGAGFDKVWSIVEEELEKIESEKVVVEKFDDEKCSDDEEEEEKEEEKKKEVKKMDVDVKSDDDDDDDDDDSDDDDSDESSDEEEEKETPTAPIPTPTPTSADSPDSNSDSSDSDSDSDSDVDPEDMNTRGTRGRGKKRTAEDYHPSPALPKKEPVKIEAPFVSKKGQFPVPDPEKKTPKKEDKRKCIGRKPVTDFAVGTKITGKVVYVKPALGAFVDIGCHSDGFVHVSRISDKFVKTADEVVKVGDTVTVRVVDVDKKKKKVTCSMQSDEMQTKEKEAMRKREEGREKKKRKMQEKGEQDSVVKLVSPSTAKKTGVGLSIPKQNIAPSKPAQSTPTPENVPKPKTVSGLKAIDTSKMSKDELKRHNKLLRRAERREEEAQ